MIKYRETSEVIVPEYENGRMPLVCLMGASFDTGNLGVSALAWSSLKIIQVKWPEAKIVILGSGRNPAIVSFTFQDKEHVVETWPVRNCPNLFAANHIVKIWASVIICRLLPFLRKYWVKSQSTLQVLLSCDLVADITGGDSFSDIYGIQRLTRGYLLKRICQIAGKPFVLLPQTYGPFKSNVAKFMARSILKRAAAIYSRDREGLDQIKRLMGSRRMKAQPKLCPDVAFALDPREPDLSQDAELKSKISELKAQNARLIGLNISGLLYNGGYTQDNMFGLACDYRSLVRNVIDYFAGQEGHYVLLMPHVIPDNMPVENDLDACRAIWKDLPEAVREKVIVLEGKYDQNEVKYWIGQCDFFLGARMHATIAALSQCTPAVGMAYSKKFAGVFETAGVKDCVVDMRQSNEQDLLKQIQSIYESRDGIRQRLEKAIPEVKRKVFSIFDELQ